MSPAPETLRRSPNPSDSPPSISISTILSRAPRAVSSEATLGPFSADRRATASIRRHVSGGPRPPPFRRITPTTVTNTSTINTANEDGDTGTTRQLLTSALESRRRRIEELRAQTNVTNTIAEQWRRLQNEDLLAGPQGNPRRWGAEALRILESAPTERPRAAATQIITFSAGHLFNEDSSDSESDDDEDPDNKFPGSMNDIRRTPPPTFITPNTSPSNATDSPTNQPDDDSSRNAYTLSCRFCANVLTKRGMRARLVADARVHIWSTDEEPR